MLNLLILLLGLSGNVQSHKFDAPLQNVNNHQGLSQNVVPTDFGGSHIAQESKESVPVFPETSFTCEGRPGGYYADVEADCKVFHICGPGYGQYRFFCSPGTFFNQKYAICDWSYNVDCKLSPDYYFINDLNLEKGEFRTEGEQKLGGPIESPKDFLSAPPQNLLPISPSPRDINTYTITVPLADLQRQHRSFQAQNFALTNQQLPFNKNPSSANQQLPFNKYPSSTNQQLPFNKNPSSTNQQLPFNKNPSSTYQQIPFNKNSASLKGISDTVLTTTPLVTVPIQYIASTPTPTPAIAHQIIKFGAVQLKPVPNRKIKISDIKLSDSLPGTPDSYAVSVSGKPDNIISSNALVSGSGLQEKNPDSKFKLTPAVLVSQLINSTPGSTESGVRTYVDHSGGAGSLPDKWKVTLLSADPVKSEIFTQWGPVQGNWRHDKDILNDRIFTQEPTGVAFIRSSLKDSKTDNDLDPKKNSFLPADMKHFFSTYDDWSRKMRLKNLESANKKPYNSDLELKSTTKTRLPLEPQVPPNPPTSDGMEIEYTEDLGLSNTASGPRNDYPGDITGLRFARFLADQMNSKTLENQPRMNPKVDEWRWDNFTSFTSKTRKPKIFKVRNKGFRPINLKNTDLTKETKALINLIKNQLNLTTSPFAISLIEIDDPYSVQYESQKLKSDIPSAESFLEDQHEDDSYLSGSSLSISTLNSSTSVKSSVQSSSREEHLQNMKSDLDKFTFSKENATDSKSKTIKITYTGLKPVKTSTSRTQSTNTTQSSSSTTTTTRTTTRTTSTSTSSSTEPSEKTRIRLTRKGIREQRIGPLL